MHATTTMSLMYQLLPLYFVVGGGVLMSGGYVLRLALGNTVVYVAFL